MVGDEYTISASEVGALLKIIRKSRNLTQDQFAKEISMSRSYLGDLENNRKKMSLHMFLKIANKLGYGLTLIKL